MPKKHETYWYQEDDSIAKAFLYHLRDGDIHPGGSIEKGEIVAGCYGFAVAESRVEGYSGQSVPYKANRRCQWNGLELRCMTHPDIPVTAKTKKDLRGFNYAIAEVQRDEERKLAIDVGVPVVEDQDGIHLINVELTTFQRQGAGNPRRAKLI